MEIAKTKLQLQEILAKARDVGKTTGFTPTMGALHAGHLSLIDIAKHHANIVVASIFVNPEQFAPDEDFDTYPRAVESDLQKLEGRGADVVYLPTKEEIYPEGFDEYIKTGLMGQILEGEARPHFFDGVATVVNQLFKHVKPDVAVFGEKDFQQLQIIRKLASELEKQVEIVGAPIMREENGLAMSSRNTYLSDDDRKIAGNLYKTLTEIKDRTGQGGNIKEAIMWGKNNLLQTGFDKVDYLEVCDINTLKPVIEKPAQLLAAVYLSGVRLLDNMQISN